MTTSSVDINETIVGTSLFQYRTENPVGVPASNWANQSRTTGLQCLVRKRPASATSPVREDGTRAPKAWNHRWFYAQQGTGRVEFLCRQGGVGKRYYHYVSADAPAVQMDPRFFDGFFASPRTASAFPFGVEQAARTEVLNKILKADFMLGVTLAEAGKTVSLLRHTATSIVEGISDFRKNARMSARDFRRFLGEMRKGPRPFHYNPVNRRTKGPWDRLLRDPRTMSRTIPEKWLEYTYGWKPLIFDIDNASKALCQMLFDEGLPMYLIVRAGKSDVDDVSLPFLDAINNGALRAFWDLRVTSACHYSIRYQKATGVLADARDPLGLGLAPTLWELTPYSFCLDWVVGVGDWLRSMGASDVADFTEGSVSKIQRIDGMGVRLEPNTSGSWQDQRIIAYPRSQVVSFGRMSREVLGSLPIPAIVPEIRNKLGLPQLASLLSLLVQSGAKSYNRI